MLFLIITIILFFMNFSAVIFKKVAKTFYVDHAKERVIINELKELSKELKVTPLVDQFAKYAKLERRKNKLQEELVGCETLTSGKVKAFSFAISRVVRLIGGLAILLIMYFNKAEPILRLDSDRLVPLSFYLGWPSGESGAVTVWAWTAVTATTFKAIERKLAACL